MTAIRKVLLGALLILLALAAGTYWVIGTDSGTRWLLGRAAPYLPGELQLGETQGSLLRGIEIGSLEWRSESTSLETGALFVHIRLLPLLERQLIVEELDIERVILRLDGESEDREESGLPTIELPIDLSLVSSSLRQLSIAVDGAERVIDEIVASASLEGSDLRISVLAVRSAWLDLDVGGHIRLADDYPGSIEADWRFIQNGVGPFAGRLSIRGDTGEYELSHAMEAPVVVTSSGSVSYTSGLINADLLHEWSSLEWPIEERTLHSSRGRLRTSGNPDAYSLDLDVNVRVDNQPDTLLRFAANGDRQALRLSSFAIQNSLGRVSTAGETEIRFEGPDVAFSDTRLQVGSNTVHLDGTLGRTLSLDADFEIIDIAEIFPEGAGSILGTVSLNGPVDRPDVQMDLEAATLRWGDYSLGSLSAKGNLTEAEKGRADLSLEQLKVGDVELDELRLSVDGRLAEHEIGLALRTMENDVALETAGGYEQQSWSGQLALLTIENRRLGRWTTRDASQLTASPERVSLSNTCLFGPHDTDQACVSASRVAEGRADFDARVSGIPVSAVAAALPEGLNLAGFVYGSLTGQWENGRLSAKSEVELRDGTIEAVYDEDRILINVTEAISETTVVDNRVESSLRLDLADGEATGTVSLSIEDLMNGQSAISGRIDASSPDISSLAAIVPGIRQPRGNLDGNLSVGGSLNSPEFRGELALTDASFGVRQGGIDVTDLELRLTQLAPGQLRLAGQARSGSGKISVEGRTQIASDSGIRSELRIFGENFELVRLPDWQVAASPSLSVVFDERATTISGELTIPTANIRVRKIPESAESVSSDAVVHRQDSVQSSGARRIDLDVRAALGDEVEFSGFGLTTGLEGAIQLKGGSHAVLNGQGRLRLRDGRYKAYGQDLEIERGELIFNGPLESPRLNIRAVRQISEIVAGIELSGTPTQLRSDIFSDPAMSDAEALSYLLTGRPLASATSSGDDNALNNAAFALGVSGAGNITSQIRSQLGLETLTIQGGADDSQLIAGKRFGDRLLVEYGYGLIDQLGTLLLRYQLNERIILESRTGTVSNLDIVYSVKKK